MFGPTGYFEEQEPSDLGANAPSGQPFKLTYSMTKSTRHRVFISYSRKDSQFVNQLDAALVAAGVKTFLDRREIKVGESIPNRVYKGIETASHIACVISEASMKSRWVQEELSAAKMRENNSAGIRVLPVLLDDVPMPSELKHVRYADFRQWQDPREFHKSFQDLLEGMGISTRVISGGEFIWYVQNAPQVRWFQYTFLKWAGELEGSGGELVGRSETGRQVAKWIIRDTQVREYLEMLLQLLGNVDPTNDSQLANLKKVTMEASKQANDIYDHVSWHDGNVADNFRFVLSDVGELLEVIRTQVENTLMASVADVGPAVEVLQWRCRLCGEIIESQRVDVANWKMLSESPPEMARFLMTNHLSVEHPGETSLRHFVAEINVAPSKQGGPK